MRLQGCLGLPSLPSKVIVFYLQNKEKAERVGFEPTRRLNTAYAISSRAPSANSDTSPEDTEKVYQILAVTRSDRPVVPQPRGDMLPRMAERRPIRKRNEVRT